MTLEEQLFNALTVLVAGKVYPAVAKQGEAAPYIIYQSVVSTTSNTLGGASNLQNTRIQVSGYANNYAAAAALGKNITAAMANASFTNIKLTDQMLYEPDVKLHRVMLDFSIWSTL